MSAYAKVRRDLRVKGVKVPVGVDTYFGGAMALPYRWVRERFQVKLEGDWLDACSIDFEMTV